MQLPKAKKISLQPNIFPTTWQAVIFHNYGFVPSTDLAKLLACDERTLEVERERLGLGYVAYNPIWRKKGYITLIRNNWFLLPYEQICQLIDVDEDRLGFILRNDDFLSVKLGDKPECENVSYFPLTEEQIEAIMHSTASGAYGGDIHEILRKYQLVALTRMADIAAYYLD